MEITPKELITKTMITKEKIAQYCVDSKGDKDLAEAIAKQFERAGFEKSPSEFNCKDFPLIGVYDGHLEGWIHSYKSLAQTTLSELTKMVDELVGDEYQIVREFLDWDCSYSHCTDKTKDKAVAHFRENRTKRIVTLTQLKEAYAEKIGIEVDKIVVREETK